METKNQNALERFISKTRKLFVNEPDLEKRWKALSPILAELIADPEVIEASKHWPDCVPRDGRAENLIFYEDPEYKFAINGLTKGEARQGGRTRIHDHAHIYTLYGVLDGRENVERYERTDDRSKPNYAKIKKTTDTPVGPGMIDLVRPYEIHAEVTVGERTVAVIIRSEKGGTFNQGRYNLETSEYFESLGPRQTPVEMLPQTAKTAQAEAGTIPAESASR
jgi:predicted metal-dependent enzyme (double-stranded beta helix superfamily)